MNNIIKYRFKPSVIFAFAIFALQLSTLHAQFIGIESGALSISDSTCFMLNETSLINQETFSTDNTSAVFATGDTTVYLSGSSNLNIHILSVESDIRLLTDLSIISTLHMGGGDINLAENNLNLIGDIISENNGSRVLSSGFGEIIKPSSDPASNNGNIGLSVGNLSGAGLLEIHRGHMVSSTESYNSISRYFTISPIAEDLTVTFNYLDAELNDLDEALLTPWIEQNGSWYPVTDFVLDTINKQLTSNIGSSFDKITLFSSEFEDVIVSTGFSPNGDGLNDYFVIEGVERYPDNELVVFNQWGEVVYKASPYYNNWSGDSENRLSNGNDNKLLDGTYFYIFYKVRNNKNTVSKGFVELKNNTN